MLSRVCLPGWGARTEKASGPIFLPPYLPIITLPMSKLDRWRVQAHRSGLVAISRAVDLSTDPRSKRASFPYDSLPPFRVLTARDVVRELVTIPSVAATAAVAFFTGVAACWLVRSARRRSAWRLLLLSAVLARLWCFVKKRSAIRVVEPLSEAVNVSSSPDGPCNVHCRVLTLSNSHAGTHADTARHFVGEQEALGREFVAEQYVGDAVIVDLVPHMSHIPGGTPRTITRSILVAALEKRVSLAGVWRFLFRTRAAVAETPTTSSSATASLRPSDNDEEDAWDPTFAHFDPDAARYLAEMCPSLLLIGLDSASVDHPNASPICHHSHGVFWTHHIAILENLDFSKLSARLQSCPSGALNGSMQTVFHPQQRFFDSHGCSVMFFPDVEAE